MMNLTQLNHFDQFWHDKLGFDCKKKGGAWPILAET
jgi:hypothetical protein